MLSAKQTLSVTPGLPSTRTITSSANRHCYLRLLMSQHGADGHNPNCIPVTSKSKCGITESRPFWIMRCCYCAQQFGFSSYRRFKRCQNLVCAHQSCSLCYLMLRYPYGWYCWACDLCNLMDDANCHQCQKPRGVEDYVKWRERPLRKDTDEGITLRDLEAFALLGLLDPKRIEQSIDDSHGIDDPVDSRKLCRIFRGNFEIGLHCDVNVPAEFLVQYTRYPCSEKERNFRMEQVSRHMDFMYEVPFLSHWV